MKGLVRSAVAAALTLSGSALANPIMVISEVYVEQFPGTTHVQVTRTYSSGASSTTPVTRDGASVAVTFDARSGGSRDLGSGMSNLTTVAGCDCFVPVGHHSYVVAGITVPLDVREASAASGTPRSPSAQCDVKCAGSIPAPAGGAGGTSSSISGAGVGNTSPSTGGVGTGGASPSTSGAGVGNTSPSTGGVGMGGVSSSTGGAGVGGATPATGGVGTGGTSRSTSTTAAKTGSTAPSATGGAPSTSVSSTAPSKNNSDDSSGCAISRTSTGLLPLGILAALGLLAFRRRK